MSKDRRTVTLEPEVNKYLKTDGVNASQLINRLVKNHQSSGGDKRDMLQLRAEQLRSDIDELEGRLDTKESELERVESQLEDLSSEREDQIKVAKAALDGEKIVEENTKVRFWMDELGVSLKELNELLEDTT